MTTFNSNPSYPDIKVYLEDEEFIVEMVTAVKTLIYEEEAAKQKREIDYPISYGSSTSDPYPRYDKTTTKYTNSSIDYASFYIKEPKPQADFKASLRTLIVKHNELVRLRVINEVMTELNSLRDVPVPEENQPDQIIP